MFLSVDIDKRKKIENDIINNIINKLFKYTNNNYKTGFIIFLFHWILTLLTFIYILFGDVDIFFYLAITIWVIIIFLHIYFNGCILTKIERKCWNTKKWHGPWSIIIKILSINDSYYNKHKNIIYLMWGLFLNLYILIKIINKKKNIKIIN